MPRSNETEVIAPDGSLLGYVVSSADGRLLAFDSEFGYLGASPTFFAARSLIYGEVTMMEEVPALRGWPRRAA
jgi:hypothetical protein